MICQRANRSQHGSGQETFETGYFYLRLDRLWAYKENRKRTWGQLCHCVTICNCVCLLREKKKKPKNAEQLEMKTIISVYNVVFTARCANDVIWTRYAINNGNFHVLQNSLSQRDRSRRNRRWWQINFHQENESCVFCFVLFLYVATREWLSTARIDLLVFTRTTRQLALYQKEKKKCVTARCVSYKLLMTGHF